ncbi:hypothetical protein FA13DRAFT_1731864 [Coprinellus micaceus]|uniref:Uncharacterized protein n=1 Tax=Coprinellus micaceus TaxID=71717 RepID=A0A4Y7TD86_COPMI|nr:hypothetical protein FA13DRAFT_1731864 [Coprinellus micaceus]
MLAELVKSCGNPQTLPVTGGSAPEITPSSLDHEPSRDAVQDTAAESSPSAQTGEGLVSGDPPPTRAVAPHRVDTFINPTPHPTLALDFVHYVPISPADTLQHVEAPNDGPSRPLSPKASTTHTRNEGVWSGSNPWVRRPFGVAKLLQRTNSMSSIASTATTGTVNTVATASTAATIVGELWGFPLHLSKL